MSVQLRSRVHAVLANLCETGGWRNLPLDSWLSRGALAAASFAAVSFIDIPTASAVPSYARQTGQPCATCHTAFPELTPYGRQFKLMGYTAGGNRCNDGSAKSDETQVPLALMTCRQPRPGSRIRPTRPPWGRRPTSATTLGTPASRASSSPGSSIAMSVRSLRRPTTRSGKRSLGQRRYPLRKDRGNQWHERRLRHYSQQQSNRPGCVEYRPRLGLPLHGLGGRRRRRLSAPCSEQALSASRSAASAPMSGSTAAFMPSFPPMAACPSASSPILTADSIPPRRQVGRNGALLAAGLRKDLGQELADVRHIRHVRQPARVPTLDDRQPLSGVTDPTLDIGVDTQYQWIGEEHAVTVRAAYIWERKKNNVENASLACARADC